MTARRILKLTHLASTIWFVLCVGYLLILALHQAGFHWWLIFSLSGHSALAIFLLVSLYLFALFRGVGRTQQIEVEHPLTNTPCYMGFYVAAPLLGGMAGVVGMVGVGDLNRFLVGVALGTLGTAFSAWVVIDPIAGLFEMLLPASRKHRAERLAQAEAERQARRQRRERLLAEAFAREEQERQRWQQHLQPQAERLAALLADDTASAQRLEHEAVRIGSEAWRLGGLTCMRQLREMALALGGNTMDSQHSPESISYWWDGIGTWRRPPVD